MKSTKLITLFLFMAMLAEVGTGAPHAKRSKAVSLNKAIIIAWSYVVKYSQTKPESDPLNYDLKVISNRSNWKVVFTPTERAMERFNIPNQFDANILSQCSVYVEKTSGKVLKATIP